MGRSSAAQVFDFALDNFAHSATRPGQVENGGAGLTCCSPVQLLLWHPYCAGLPAADIVAVFGTIQLLGTRHNTFAPQGLEKRGI